MKGNGRLAFPIAAILLGTLLALAAGECLLRAMPGLMPMAAQIRHRADSAVKVDSELWLPDDYLGYKLPPGLDVLLEAFPERPYRVRTIGLGYDGIGFRSPPRDGRPVAALVGDSFTFAEGVSAEEAWWTHLARETGWNVLNLGLNGYGPPQYTRTMMRYALPLRPGLVLWMFCPNDFDNAYDFHTALEDGRGALGYRVRKRHSAVANALDAAWTALRDHLVLLDSIAWTIHAWKHGGAVSVDTGKVRFAAQWSYWQPLVAVNSERIRKGWQWTQQDLLEARDAAREAGAELAVVVIPFREQVYWNLLEGKLPDWGEADPGAPGRMVADFCKRNGIRVLDLAPAFAEAARRGDEQYYFAGDGHWNPPGNGFAARTIAGFLENQGLLPPAAPATSEQAR